MSESQTNEPVEITADELDGGLPAYTAGEWYMFATPGGFTMRGQYVRPLGYGMHRFVHVKHMRNAGGRELPELCQVGPSDQTVFTTFEWPIFSVCPIWSAPWSGPRP